MNVYCDNYSICNAVAVDKGAGTLTEDALRARGWHVYHGRTQGGYEHNATLCPGCAGSRRRALAPPPGRQPGQQELWVLEAIVEDE